MQETERFVHDLNWAVNSPSLMDLTSRMPTVTRPLKFSDIAGHGKMGRNLCSVGVVVTWLVAATAAHYSLDLTWQLSFLFGAIVTVTGPTVIVPMLRTVRPKTNLAFRTFGGFPGLQGRLRSPGPALRDTWFPQSDKSDHCITQSQLLMASDAI